MKSHYNKEISRNIYYMNNDSISNKPNKVCNNE